MAEIQDGSRKWRLKLDVDQADYESISRCPSDARHRIGMGIGPRWLSR